MAHGSLNPCDPALFVLQGLAIYASTCYEHISWVRQAPWVNPLFWAFGPAGCQNAGVLLALLLHRESTGR